jgi:hypothetical protein
MQVIRTEKNSTINRTVAKYLINKRTLTVSEKQRNQYTNENSGVHHLVKLPIPGTFPLTSLGPPDTVEITQYSNASFLLNATGDVTSPLRRHILYPHNPKTSITHQSLACRNSPLFRTNSLAFFIKNHTKIKLEI